MLSILVQEGNWVSSMVQVSKGNAGGPFLLAVKLSGVILNELTKKLYIALS